MCGRYSLTEKDIGVVADALGAHYEDELVAAHAPRYNVAPTQPAPIVRAEGGERWLRTATWGFVSPRDRKLAINVRAETVDKRPGIRDTFAARRCVVPADGFFEWRGEKSARQPIWFHRPEGGLVYLAGLWEPGADGKPPQFVVITTRPNDLVAPVHDRMPVVLDAEHARAWLEHADTGLLVPAANDALVATPVSPRVNDVKNDDASCLTPPADEAAAPPAKKQLRLI